MRDYVQVFGVKTMSDPIKLLESIFTDAEEAEGFDYLPHFDSLQKITETTEYQMCGTRLNCAVTTLWYCVDYCTKHCPEIARFAPGGGCEVSSMTMFSSFYAILTNTTKHKKSKSNFSYACAQNLHNHFIPIRRSRGFNYYYHPHFLPEYPGPLTRSIVKDRILPWKRNVPKAVLQRLLG